PIEELADAIRAINNGRRIYAPELVDMFYNDDDLFENPLTDRESDVLTLIAAGKSTKEVAKELFLSHGTVRNYMSLILNKLQVRYLVLPFIDPQISHNQSQLQSKEL